MKPTKRARMVAYDPAVWMSRAEAADYAGVSLRTLCRWLAKGLLTRHLTGEGNVLVSRKELENFLSPKACTRPVQHA